MLLPPRSQRYKPLSIILGTPKHDPPYILGMAGHNLPYRLAWCIMAQVTDTWTLRLSIMSMIHLKLWHYKAQHYHCMAEVAHTQTLMRSTSGTTCLNILHRVAWHYCFTAKVHLLWFIFGLYMIFLTCSVVSGPFYSTSTAAWLFIWCLVFTDCDKSTLYSKWENSCIRLRVYWILMQKDQMSYSSPISSSNFSTSSSFSPAPMDSQATPNQGKGWLVVLIYALNGRWEEEWRRDEEDEEFVQLLCTSQFWQWWAQQNTEAFWSQEGKPWSSVCTLQYSP